MNFCLIFWIVSPYPGTTAHRNRSSFCIYSFFPSYPGHLSLCTDTHFHTAHYFSLHVFHVCMTSSFPSDVFFESSCRENSNVFPAERDFNVRKHGRASRRSTRCNGIFSDHVEYENGLTFQGNSGFVLVSFDWFGTPTNNKQTPTPVVWNLYKTIVSEYDLKGYIWFAVLVPKLYVLRNFYSGMQFLVSWKGQVARMTENQKPPFRSEPFSYWNCPSFPHLITGIHMVTNRLTTPWVGRSIGVPLIDEAEVACPLLALTVTILWATTVNHSVLMTSIPFLLESSWNSAAVKCPRFPTSSVWQSGL